MFAPFAPGPGGVTLRDALMARAGVKDGLNWDGWNYYFGLVTNVDGQYASSACVANPSSTSSTMSVDTYLGYLEQVGTSTCPAVQYLWPNGGSANAILGEMIKRAGDENIQLRWDQWNTHLTALTQITGALPQQVCMTEQSGVYPNSFLLLTARQWLLFYEHIYVPNTISCRS